MMRSTEPEKEVKDAAAAYSISGRGLRRPPGAD
jgi:hypothetical protein